MKRNNIIQKPYNSTKKVALYCRVSTDEQAKDGYGIDSQIRLCKALIESNADKGWEYDPSLVFIDDGISGATEIHQRPALSKLHEEVLNNNVNVLLVWKIDRLFRKVTLLLEYIESLNEKGVNFVSKSETIDLSSPSGRFTLILLGAVAEMERETIRERTTEGRISKSMLGYFVYGKNVAYGYKKVHDGRGNKLEINDEEAKIVKKIFDMYLNEGKGSGEIARYLTSLGIGTNIDNRNDSTKENKNLFRQTWIVKVLRNEIYIGNCYVNKTETKKLKDGKVYKVDKDRSQWILIKTPEIIDINTFDKVQEKLDDSFSYSGRGERHMFTGKVKCGFCNHSYYHYKSHKGTGNYRCGGKKKDKVSASRLCTNQDISEEKLLTLVWPKIDEFLNNPEKLIKDYKDIYLKNDGLEQKKSLGIELIKLDENIKKKEGYIKNAIKDRLENPNIRKQFEDVIEDYSNDIQALENRKLDILKQIKRYDSMQHAYDTILQLSEIYKNEVKDFKEIDKQEYIDKLVDSIIMKKESVVVKYRFEIN